MSDADVNQARRQLNVRVSGFDVPKPLSTFEQAGFDKLLLGAIAKHGYTKPTPIQCQVVPAQGSARSVAIRPFFEGLHFARRTLGRAGSLLFVRALTNPVALEMVKVNL